MALQRADPLLETQVSEYVIKERIGAGGMGIVYRAVQPLIGKQVAIKVLKAEYASDADVVQRLLVEARVVNAIQHRGIIDIFGFGQLPDGRPYVVMELLHGQALSTYIRKRRRLAADEAVGILDEILSALGTAHKGGVIHRDLKPGNVFLVENGDEKRSVKLLDFGIAKVLQFRPARPLTAQGNILGTPEYMAPEQVRGEEVGPTTDLYAVGIIAFQMLTGRLPFIGESTGVLLAQIDEKPPAPSSLVPEIPPALESIVLRLLAKQASKRFPSAEAVRKELSALGTKRVTSVPPSHSEPASKSEPATRSLGPRTIEVPMLSAAADETDVAHDLETEPAPIEPFTDPSLLRRAIQRRPRWHVAAGVAVLVLCTGAVAFTALRGSEPAPEPVAAAPARRPEPTPAPPAPSPSPPHAAEQKAQAEPLPKPKKRPATPRPVVEVSTTKESLGLASAATSTNRTDSKALLARTSEAEARMLKINPLICTNSSPAFAALKELEKQIQASTDADRVKLASQLDAWEQKFLPKP